MCRLRRNVRIIVQLQNIRHNINFIISIDETMSEINGLLWDTFGIFLNIND